MNGVIPNLTGGRGGSVGPTQGVATYGSDSGHAAKDAPAWALVDEAIKNLGYMQMKKTHDAATTLIERMYGRRPAVTYYIGTSQGGREALTVAQRYPDDYDGIISNVPIVNFSSLMLAPELIRIQEKPIANWVTRAKVNAIRGEFMRQCDGLDGLVDGIINNYMACRAIFDVKEGARGRRPWAARRCPDNVDPDPANTTATACLTDGQISTLEFVYSRYTFATSLAHGVKTFGMWLPNTDPSGSGLISDVRFRGQEGAAADAPMHSHLGVLGVTGFLMRDLAANPLDYSEGGALNGRRQQLSAWLDSTDPDLSRFAASWRQDDRDDWHGRHARLARRPARLLPVVDRQNESAEPGAICAALRHAPGRARTEREELLRRRGRKDAGGRTHPEHVRSGTSADGLGRAKECSCGLGRRDRWREEPSTLLVSDIPAVCPRPDEPCGLVRVRRAVEPWFSRA